MRYPEGHKREVRARIVKAAADALRTRGLAGVGIPALMKRAGLTHGGFYAHFRDRDELVAEAVKAAGQETAEDVFGEGLELQEAAARYLSPQHLQQPARGCVVAALGADGARQAGRVRRAFAQTARGLLHLVQQKLQRRGGKGALSDEALVLTSTLVGAVVLGRLLDDPALAARLLRAARKSIASA